MEEDEQNERADDDEEGDEEGAEHVVVLMRAANADNGAACMEGGRCTFNATSRFGRKSPNKQNVEHATCKK